MTWVTYMQTHNTNTQTGTDLSIYLQSTIAVLKEAAVSNKKI